MIHIPSEDFPRLRKLARTMTGTRRNGDEACLQAELDHAVVLERELLPSGVVTVGSRVRFRDVESGEVDEYALAWPEDADLSKRRISVLAPIGTALLGYRVGDELTWPTPGGVRRLRVMGVEPAPTESREDEPETILERLLYGQR